MPVTQEKCVMSACDISWKASSWSNCSALCGKGIQHRDVICKSSNDVVSDKYCEGLLKPKTIQICEGDDCFLEEDNNIGNEFMWHVGNWSEVICYDKFNIYN